MSVEMVELIKKTIHADYCLSRDERDWLLDDNVKLRLPDRHSFGFSLDNPCRPPFAFFSGNPPKHIAKMCDAFIALSYDDTTYIFIIEQKTADSGEYKNQLMNGKLFCDWLGDLYRAHKPDFGNLVYIGLLIWQPRRDPDRDTPQLPTKPKKHLSFDNFFNIKNKKNIHLKELIRQLER